MICYLSMSYPLTLPLCLAVVKEWGEEQMPNKYLLKGSPLIIVQKKERGEESPGKEKEGQGQEASPEGKGQTPTKEAGQSQSRGAAGAQLFGGVGGEKVPAGSEACGGLSVATGAPEENYSKAFSHLFIFQFW